MADKQLEGLETLEVWQKSRDFANLIYQDIFPQLPGEEKYNLGSQLRRASVSIPANIAEGYGRFYYQSNVQFCYYARGSLVEVISHLIFAHDQGFITDPVFFRIREIATSLLRLINGYVAYLKKAKLGENEPGSPNNIKDESANYDIEVP